MISIFPANCDLKILKFWPISLFNPGHVQCVSCPDHTQCQGSVQCSASNISTITCPRDTANPCCPLGWSDLPLFCYFRNWTHCCRSGTYILMCSFFYKKSAYLTARGKAFIFESHRDLKNKYFFLYTVIQEQSPIWTFYILNCLAFIRPPKLAYQELVKENKICCRIFLHFKLF